MTTSITNVLFTVFFIFWIILALSFWIIMKTRSSTAEKRQWYRRITIFSGVMMGLFQTVIIVNWHQPVALLVIWPVIGLIIWLGIDRSYFCDSCGKMARSTNLFTKIKFCPKCGAEYMESKL